jgi:hypothetical protein
MFIKIALSGGRIVDKHCLYDANMTTKINKRCCTLLCFTSPPIAQDPIHKWLIGTSGNNWGTTELNFRPSSVHYIHSS